jgi:uncharacterized membrane protein
MVGAVAYILGAYFPRAARHLLERHKLAPIAAFMPLHYQGYKTLKAYLTQRSLLLCSLITFISLSI